MVVRGHVEEGRIVLDEEAPLKEGMKVRIELLAETTTNGENESAESSLYDRMKEFVGSVEGLPADAAENHDHYLHGQPKRQ